MGLGDWRGFGNERVGSREAKVLEADSTQVNGRTRCRSLQRRREVTRNLWMAVTERDGGHKWVACTLKEQSLQEGRGRSNETGV